MCRVRGWEYLHENAGSCGLKPKTINAERGLSGTVGVLFPGTTESMCRFKHGSTCRGNMSFLETTHFVCRVLRWDNLFFFFFVQNTINAERGLCGTVGVLFLGNTQSLCRFKHGTTRRGRENMCFLETTHFVCRVLGWDNPFFFFRPKHN